MCGFIGIVNWQDGISPKDEVAARAGLAALVHRGPDSDGEWRDDHAYLGHQRLKVIDLSDNGGQPFVSNSRRVVAVYNGEIYNYREMRDGLAAANGGLKSETDTEVVVAAVEHSGINAFNEFDGMFAAAFHFPGERRHLLVRDPLGQKPLYYAIVDRTLIYASELGAFLALSPRYQWKIGRTAFRRYLANCCYMGEETPLAGVFKLQPGHFAEWRPGGLTIERYWTSEPGGHPESRSFDDAIAEFDRLFSVSVRRSLRADVPLGVFFSGGIDSSLVTSEVVNHAPDVRTFTVAMSEPDFDESSSARAASAHIGVRNRFTFDMDRDQVVAAVDDFFRTVTEPHGDPGYVNSLFLAGAARAHTTVGLAGDGADELFAGYVPFQGLAAHSLAKRLPSALVAAMRGALDYLVAADDGYAGFGFKARGFLQGYPSSPETVFPLWLSSLPLRDLAALTGAADDPFFCGSGAPGTIFHPEAAALRASAAKTPHQMLSTYYQRFFLPDFVCHHTGRAAMRHSLEVRAPFLSRDLIRFANRLPDAHLASRGRLKRVLRGSLRRRGFPAAIWKRRKTGFTFPVARWMKTALRSRLEAIRDPGEWDDALIDAPYLNGLIDTHLSGRRNSYRALFSLMTFHAWRHRWPGLIIDDHTPGRSP